jgi:GNAT superfamily N-acetyltransferase
MDNEITIQKLSPQYLNDYLAYFDHEAFTDNPRWASCYCFFHQAPHHEKAWQERDAAENRAGATDLIQRGELRGYLAYLDGKAVGWVNANARGKFTTFDPPEIPEGETLAMIVCFNVAPPYRGMGIARKLLDAALDGLKRDGMEKVLVFTRTDESDAAANHHGPMKMYLDAGFVKIQEREPLALLQKEL